MISSEDKEKTAFSVGNGLWQFIIMPFGLYNAPATFELLMERVLQNLFSKICLVYLDDVIVYGKTYEEVLRDTDWTKKERHRLNREHERGRDWNQEKEALRLKGKTVWLLKKSVSPAVFLPCGFSRGIQGECRGRWVFKTKGTTEKLFPPPLSKERNAKIPRGGFRQQGQVLFLFFSRQQPWEKQENVRGPRESRTVV